MLRTLLICSFFSAVLHVGVFAVLGTRSSSATARPVAGNDSAPVTMHFVDAIPQIETPEAKSTPIEDAIPPAAELEPFEIVEPAPIAERESPSEPDPSHVDESDLDSEALADLVAIDAPSEVGVEPMTEVSDVGDLDAVENELPVIAPVAEPVNVSNVSNGTGLYPILPLVLESWESVQRAACKIRETTRDRTDATADVSVPVPTNTAQREEAQRVSAGVRSNNAPPRYPRSARRQGLEGTVELMVRVLANGRAGTVRVERSSGHQVLDDAAIRSVKSWQFEPGRIGTEKVEDWILVPVEFRLN